MKTTQIVSESPQGGMPTAKNFKMDEVELSAIYQSEELLEGIYYSANLFRQDWVKDYIPPFDTAKLISGEIASNVHEKKFASIRDGGKGYSGF